MKDAVLRFMRPSYFLGRKNKTKESVFFCIGLSSYDFHKYNLESFHLHKGQRPLVQLKALGAAAQRMTLQMGLNARCFYFSPIFFTVINYTFKFFKGEGRNTVVN